MRSAWTVLVSFALAAAAAGDQFQIAGEAREGTLRGYANGRFEYTSEKGRIVKEPAIRVIKLVLSQPKEVVYTTTDGKLEEGATFKGYDKKIFAFALKNGSAVSVPQLKMKSIEVVFRPDVAAGEAGPRVYPVPDVDLATVERAGLTPAQLAAIGRFEDAKKAYDTFVAENGRLVGEMEKLTGAKREAILDELRKRRGDEPPLKSSLVAAYKELMTAFPNASREKPAAGGGQQ